MVDGSSVARAGWRAGWKACRFKPAQRQFIPREEAGSRPSEWTPRGSQPLKESTAHERTNERSNERTNEATNERTKQRTNGKRTNERSNERTENGRTSEANAENEASTLSANERGDHLRHFCHFKYCTVDFLYGVQYAGFGTVAVEFCGLKLNVAWECSKVSDKGNWKCS